MTIYNTQFDDEGYSVLSDAIGFTSRFGSSTMYPTVGSPAIKRVYAAFKNTVAGYFVRSWDRIDSDADRATCNAVTCFKYDDATVTHAALIIRGQGNFDSACMLTLYLATGSIQLEQRYGSPSTSVTCTGPSISASYTFTAGHSYFFEIEANGTTLNGYIWDAEDGHDGKPATPTVTGTTVVTAAGWIGVGGYHATLSGKVFPVNFLNVGTGGDAAIPNRTNAEFTEFLRSQIHRRIFLAEFGYTRYDASGGASSPSVYNPTGKIYISKGGFTSKSYDTPANQPYRDCIKKVPTFSKKMGPLLTGKAEVSFGAMDVDNPVDESVRRQNKVIRSNEPGYSGNLKNNCTITDNVAAAYDGTVRAASMVENTAVNAFHDLAQLTPGVAFTKGKTYFIAVKVKANGRTKGEFGFYDALPFGSYQICLFDLTAKTIAISSGTPVFRMTELADGWFEIVVGATCTVTRAATYSFFLRPRNAAGSTQYTGDGVSGLYVDQLHCYESTASSQYVATGSVAIDETVNPSTAGIRDYWTRLLTETNDYLLLMGFEDWPRFDFRPIIRGRIGDCTTPDARTLRFPIRGMDDILSGDLNPTVIETGPNTGLRYPRFFGTTGTADYYPQYEATQLDDASYTYIIEDRDNTSAPNLLVFEDGAFFGCGLDSGATISAVNTGTGTITSTFAAQLAVDSMVYWYQDAPLGLTLYQHYFVIAAGKTSTEFRVSATRGGAAITGGSAVTTGLFVGKNYYLTYSGPSTFTLTVAPVGRITFTHYAEYPIDTRSVVYSAPNSLSRMLENIIFWKMGASLNFLDQVSFDAMYTAGSSESESISTYTGSRPATAAKIVGDLLAGNSAWCMQDANGYWRAGYLDVPTGTATRNLGGSEIDPDGILLESTIRKVDFSKVSFSHSPWHLFGGPIQGADQIAINGKQYLSPYSYGTPALPLDNFPSFAYADEVKAFESARCTETGAGNHRLRLVTVFKKKSGIFRAPASAQAIEWGIGDIAQIDHDRFDWKNFSATNPSSPDNTESFNASKALVVGIDADPDSDSEFGNIVRLWRPIPAIFPADEILENPI